MIEWNGCFFFFTICKDSDIFFLFPFPAARVDLHIGFLSGIPDAGTGSVPCAHAAEHESIQRLISHG